MECFLTHWGRDKWPLFSRRYFQMHFLEWKYLNFDSDFIEFLFLKVHLTIFQHWLDYRRIYALLGLNELTFTLLHDVSDCASSLTSGVLRQTNGIYGYSISICVATASFTYIGYRDITVGKKVLFNDYRTKWNGERINVGLICICVVYAL